MKVLLFALVLSVVGLAASEISCPKVFDGLTNGHFDLATQFSVSEINANWVGLANNQILGYEWAIISDAKVNKQLSQADCRMTQGFSGIPDVQNWVDVKKDTSASASGLKLTPKTTYYVVLRTTLSDGSHVFSMSNGIFILPQELNLEGSHKRVEQESPKENTRNPESFTSECPIDLENRCRKSTISVRDILSELYGPPRFSAEPVFVAAVAGAGGDDDDDDDDDDGGAGPILGIIVGAVIGAVALLLACCLLLLLLGLLFRKGGGESKFTENVRTQHTEAVDADYGTTAEHTIADDTRVEFPDIDASTRLSVA